MLHGGVGGDGHHADLGGRERGLGAGLLQERLNRLSRDGALRDAWEDGDEGAGARKGYNPERHGELKTGLNGALDHVALTCSGFDATKARCEELGIEYRVNDRQFGDLRQVFVLDPNDINLELNFPGD